MLAVASFGTYSNFGLINFGSANYNDQFSHFWGHALKIGSFIQR